MSNLDDFRVCRWETLHLSRRQVDLIEVEAVRHPGHLALTSCQRSEFYGFGPCDCDAPLREYGADALYHLAAVAAGLEAVVLGEDEVLGQVRAAIAEAPAAVAAIAEPALAAARELRRRHKFDAHSGHLLDRALLLQGLPATGRLLVVGTGQVARLVATRAREIGFSEITIAGRTRPTGKWFEAGGYPFVPLETLPGLPPFAIAVGCLASSAGELDPARDLPPVTALLVDLGTPRNFAAASVAGTPIATIASLLADEATRRHGPARRRDLRAELDGLLDHRLAQHDQRGDAGVGALRQSVERVRERVAARALRLHPEIPGEAVEAVTRTLVNQIFHLPAERLRQLDDPAITEQVVTLFRQEPEEAS